MRKLGHQMCTAPLWEVRALWNTAEDGVRTAPALQASGKDYSLHRHVVSSLPLRL